MLAKVHRDLAVHIIWILFLIGASILLLSDRLPGRWPFLTDRTFFVTMIELELAFILLVWPLALSRSLRECADPREALSRGAFQAAGLVLFALPLNLVGQAISNAGAAELMKATGLVAGDAALVAALYVLARSMSWDLHPYYFLGLFVTQIMLPYAGYLIGARSGLNAMEGLKIFSPFWTATTIHADASAFFHAGAALTLAALLAFAAAHGRRESQSSVTKPDSSP